MIDLEGKTVLITGAARGLGRLMAEKMALSGATIILHSRDKSHTLSLESSLSSLGCKVISEECDLADINSVSDMLDRIEKYDVDVVFNNAGIQVTYRSDVFSTVAQDYDKSFRVNTTAPMMICYRLLPGMLKKGFGRIINTTSGIDGEPQQGPYSASKAALDKVTKDLCLTVDADKDVLIYLTDPGWCRTDLGGPSAPNDPSSAINAMIAPCFMAKTSSCRMGTIIHAQDYVGMSVESIVDGLESGIFPR